MFYLGVQIWLILANISLAVHLVAGLRWATQSCRPRCLLRNLCNKPCPNFITSDLQNLQSESWNIMNSCEPSNISISGETFCLENLPMFKGDQCSVIVNCNLWISKMRKNERTIDGSSEDVMCVTLLVTPYMATLAPAGWSWQIASENNVQTT